jgi:hypothetical protein
VVIINLNPPNGVPRGVGMEIHVLGGIPPIEFAISSPPSPPGTTVTLYPPSTALVNVPPNTPPGTPVEVKIQDKSNPPQTAEVKTQVV